MRAHQTKSFLHSKEHINKMKRQPTEWEKILPNDTSDKKLIFKFTKSSYNSIPKNKTKTNTHSG